jgi:hypothetical protein
LSFASPSSTWNHIIDLTGGSNRNEASAARVEPHAGLLHVFACEQHPSHHAHAAGGIERDNGIVEYDHGWVSCSKARPEACINRRVLWSAILSGHLRVSLTPETHRELTSFFCPSWFFHEPASKLGIAT